MPLITNNEFKPLGRSQSMIQDEILQNYNLDDKPEDSSTISIVEPRQLIRECLCQCLSMGGLEQDVIAFASIEQWEASAIGRAKGDMVIIYHDPHSPHPAGACRTEALTSRIGPDFNVVLICDSDDPGDVTELLSKGVKGYVPTSVGLRVAIQALRLVWAGGIFVPANSLLKQRGGGDHIAVSEPRGMFTPRQAAVLAQLQQGKANKIIAFALEMKESTVKVHVRNIMRKVGASNRTEVAVRSYDARMSAKL